MHKIILNILPILAVLPVFIVSTPLIFIEEIQLEENRDHFINGVFSNISFDAGGNFYFLDAKAKNVKKYSPAGKLLKVIGKEGEGPGEFIFPRWIVMIGNRLYVGDIDGNYKIFSLDGNFIENSKLYSSNSRLYEYNNLVIGVNYIKVNNHYATVYSQEGKIIAEIGNEKDFKDLMISPWGTIFMASDSKGNLYFIPEKGERIVKYDNNYRKVKQFQSKPGKRYNMPSEASPPLVFYSDKETRYSTKPDEKTLRWFVQYTPTIKIEVSNDKYLIIEYGNFRKGFFLDIYNLDGKKLIDEYALNMTFLGVYKDILYFLKVDEDAEFMYSICKYKLNEKELSRPLPPQRK